ncbi:hypothetical protein TD95_000863 [Thielaviopsis punctulata]|uniref:DUF202 domain-containing protein n=1 Tax=Thielaviopsis punctulata TaxID=72032 RepID=A0A0F4Z8C6_9PEZI|nr:hypothetical protein TD95_000863 [Thielaviopsis punctulata]
MGVDSPTGPKRGSRTFSEESLPDETTTILSSRSNVGYHTTQSNENVSRRRSAYSSRSGVNQQANGQNPNSAQRADADDEAVEDSGFLATIRGFFQPRELENKGSVARDHLAIERTFLAWLRTSLAFASIGIAITQLFRLNTSLRDNSSGLPDERLSRLRHIGKPLGATFLGLSIVILLLGYQRYTMTTAWVIQGKFPASRTTILLVATATFGLMLTSLVVVILVHPNIKKV